MPPSILMYTNIISGGGRHLSDGHLGSVGHHGGIRHHGGGGHFYFKFLYSKGVMSN